METRTDYLISAGGADLLVETGKLPVQDSAQKERMQAYTHAVQMEGQGDD